MTPSAAPDQLTAAFTHSGFFVIRSPLLPFSELAAWGEATENRSLWEQGVPAECLDQAWEHDAHLLRHRLRSILERPEVQHALSVASTSLQLGIESWKSNPGDKKGLQAERALVRYFSRMAGRSTPFGLFSGCSTGRVTLEDGAVPSLALAHRGAYRLSCRLDFDYLFALTAALQRNRTVSDALRYWPNASLHRIGSAWHYLESRVAGAERSLHLVKVEADEYVNAALDAASHGATVPELAALISGIAKPEVTLHQASEYIRELIAQHVLESTLAPLVTGQPALDDLIAQMQPLPELSAVAETLSWARGRLLAIGQKGLRASPQDYAAVAARLQSVPETSQAGVDPSRLFQVDMVKPVQSAVLTREVIDELLHAVELLCRFSSPVEGDALKDFRDAFTSRYDQAWVPLAHALDEDIGVGFGHLGRESSPFLRGLRFARQDKQDRPTANAAAILMRKLLEAPQAHTELELALEDLPPIHIAARALPDAFTVLAVLVASSVESLRKGDFKIFLKGLAGPGGARPFARFCHADPQLEQFVRSHLRQEEALRPEAVFAEIVYLPDERMGNVVCRPVLREHELVYLGRSGAPPHRQLPLSDLLIAVRNDRILLRSKRLGKEVIPRLTNAHGFLNPKLPSVYRFLCHLQHQGVVVPNFSWNAPETLDFLPRVRVGRVILAPARWHLRHDDINQIARPEKARRFAAVQELRRKRMLPRWVVFEQSDQTLPVDLDNVLSIDAFVHAVKRHQQANLLELFPGPDQLCLEGPEGRFCHDLHVPLVRKHPESKQAPEIPHISLHRGARLLPPGSDWLFVKLYGGPAAVDDALSALRPLVLRVIAGEIAAQWFFVRYRDPQHHLRIRFQGNPARLSAELMPLISAAFTPLLEIGTVYKIQFDTYEREIERYGGFEGVVASEELFWADSDAVLEILSKLSGDEGLDSRWRAALLGIDLLLTDFGFDLRAKRSLIENLRDSYCREFHLDAKDKQSLGGRFRALRPGLEALLDPSQPTELDFARSAFERRSARNRTLAAKLRALAHAERLHAPIHDLVLSYAHMHVNRMLRSDWRDHELVLYDFLFRLYDSRSAREPAR